MSPRVRAPAKKNFNVWLTPEEKKLLQQVAKELGVDMGTACKLGIRALSKKQPKEAKDDDKRDD